MKRKQILARIRNVKRYMKMLEMKESWTNADFDLYESKEFEYFSKYDRINAKGIEDEIISEMFSKYRRKYKIVEFYRVED